MKKYIPILLSTSLLLSACSIDWNNKKDNLFEKKQECAKYRDEMLKDAISVNEESLAKASMAWHEYNLEIEEIFYSKKYNSCLYQLSTYKLNWIKIPDISEKQLLSKSIYDYFSKKEIINTLDNHSEEEFDKKLKELKWE